MSRRLLESDGNALRILERHVNPAAPTVPVAALLPGDPVTLEPHDVHATDSQGRGWVRHIEPHETDVRVERVRQDDINPGVFVDLYWRARDGSVWGVTVYDRLALIRRVA